MTHEQVKTGLVIGITGNMASIQLNSSGSCETCKTRIVCNPENFRTHTLVAANISNAKIGQKVIVKEKGNFMLLLSFMQFGVPLTGLLIGIFIAATFFSNFSYFAIELLMTLIGVVGLTTGGLITRIWAKHVRLHPPFLFEIVTTPPEKQIRNH